MKEKEAINTLNEILEEWRKILNIKDERERELEMSMYFEEMPFEEIQTLLQLLEQKDKRIDDLEKSLADEAIKSTEKINKLKNRLKSDIEIGLKELKNEEWYTQKYAVFSNCAEYANEILKMLEE